MPSTLRFLLSLLLLLPLALRAELILVGDVLNEATLEPIPNVHIYIQGTKQGTTSNAEGSFCLKAQIDRPRKLIVSAVGYHTQRYEVAPNTMAGMQILLQEKTAYLSEVVALPGENRAIPLIAQVRAHRSDNDITLRPSPNPTLNTVENTSSALHTSKQHLFVSHISKRQLQRQLWQSLQSGLLSQSDSTFLLPLYRSEQQTLLSGSHIVPVGAKSEQSLLFSATDYSFLLSFPQHLNFYHNTIDLLGESFLSPLASSGNTYYRYYLADSIPGAYLVHFRTKNPFYATFNGELWIDSATFAIRSIQAHVPVQSRVNYLSQLHISQHFSPSHTLYQEQISVLLDFAIKSDTSHIFPTLLLQSSLTANHPTTAYINTDTNTISEQAPTSDQDSLSYLQSSHSPNSQNTNTQTANTISALDSAFISLDSIPLVRVATFAATVFTTGYIPTGTCIDIGNIREIFDYGESEFLHLGLPLRTNQKLSKHFCLEASVGYGFRDQKWKGTGRMSFLLPTSRRNILRLSYQDHYIATEVDPFYQFHHENYFGFQRFDFTSFLLRKAYSNTSAVNTYSRQRQFALDWQSDWSDRVETRIYTHIGRWDPYYTTENHIASPTAFPTFNNLAPAILATSPYRYQSFGATLRLGWGERKVDGFFLRRYVYSHYPTLFLQAEAGAFQPLNTPTITHHLYVKLQLLVKQRARLGMAGTLDWSLGLGYIFGNVPFPMLHHFEGNQTYAFDPYRFTLMNDLHYSTRAWCSLHSLWNGQGILFNLIPGLRYLRLHELIDFKLAWGDHSLLREPYTELGVGVGNILRIGEVYAIWRLTQRHDTTSPLFGIRFRLHLGL